VDEEEGFLEGALFGEGEAEGGVVGAELLLEIGFYGSIRWRSRGRGRRDR